MRPSSISNRKLTLLRKLNRKKYRRSKQLFIAEGGRTVEQIVKNGGVEVRELFFDGSQAFWEQEYWSNITAKTDSSIIDEDIFVEVSDTGNPQGVMALCRIPEEASLEELAGNTGIIIASDAIQDPGNLGTIIRTATWFGVIGFLAGKGTVDLFHPKVVRATAGATGTIPSANVALQDSLPFFEEKGWDIILLDAGSESVSLTDIIKRDKTILVVGNEANGIEPSLFSSRRKKVQINSFNDNGVESLNAAVALAVALYALNIQT